MILQLALLFLIGCSIGSFLNVVIYRLPYGRGVGGRSQCPHCEKHIAWHDLIPIVSFVILRARCRYCRGAISWRYPFIELYSGGIFVTLFFLQGEQGIAHWLFIFFLAEIFLALFWIDLEHLILPDAIILTGFLGALLYGVLELLGVTGTHLNIISIDHALAGLGFFGLLFLIWLYSKGAWLGLGDAKLLGLIGLIFGFMPGLFILYVAVIMGGITGLYLLLTERGTLKTKLPLGAFLGIAGTFYLLYGYAIIEMKSIFVILNIFNF